MGIHGKYTGKEERKAGKNECVAIPDSIAQDTGGNGTRELHVLGANEGQKFLQKS
jgi:hypothetical protein